MRRMSAHNKISLRDGKYILEEKSLQTVEPTKTVGGVDDSFESPRQSNIKTGEDNRRVHFSTREALATEMTSSAIYPRKIDYIPKHFTSRKVSQYIRDSVENSPIKLEGLSRQPSGLLTTRERRVSLRTLPVDTESNMGSDQNYNAEMSSEIRECKSIIVPPKNMEERVEQLQAVNRQLTSRLRQFESKQLQQKYHLSPEQQIIWLKKNLDECKENCQKLRKENSHLQSEVLFMKERIKGLVRTNHSLEIENARFKAQLISDEELTELCCPEHQKDSISPKSNSINQIEIEIERLKSDISRLETSYRDSKCFSSSVKIIRSAEHIEIERATNIRNNIYEKISILQAKLHGYEKKDLLIKSITHLVTRFDTDHKMILQLRRELENKEQIIAKMDILMTDISQQLASCKKELAKQFDLQMCKSAATSTSLAGSRSDKFDYSESPSRKRSVRFSQDIEDSKFIDLERRKQRIQTVQSQIIEDSDYNFKRLEMDCINKQRLIDRYESEIIRLSKLLGIQAQIASITNEYDMLLSELDCAYGLKQMSSSLQVKRKQIGNSKTNIISIKRS